VKNRTVSFSQGGSDQLQNIGIRRHIKIKADANPYMPEYAKYFWGRRHNKEARLLGALSARAYRAMRA
jgi:RNA-directed DNA polymerase